jgi:hypothetical protein
MVSLLRREERGVGGEREMDTGEAKGNKGESPASISDILYSRD